MKRLLLSLLVLCMSAVFADNQNLVYTTKTQDELIHLQSLLGRKHKLHEYHIAVSKVAEYHPEVIRYAVANCKMILGDAFLSYTLPRRAVINALFAQNKENGAFVTYNEYLSTKEACVAFSSLDSKNFTLMTIRAYEKLPRDFKVNIAGTIYHRDSIIREIESSSTIGNYILSIEKDFLLAAENEFWEFEIEAHTDASGNLAVDSTEFSAASELLGTVQLSWRGIHESFTHAQFIVNGKEIHNGEALNFEPYKVAKNINAKNNTCKVTASGGPANADIKVTLADCG